MQAIVRDYLSFSLRISFPFFQVKVGLGEALGLHSMVASPPALTGVDLFKKFLEKSGPTAEKTTWKRA